MLKFCISASRLKQTVNPGSKAASSGVREGDVISTIDGLSTTGLSKQDAHGLLRQAGPTLTLGLSGSGSRRKGNAKRSSEAVVVNGSAQPVVQEPSPLVEATSTANDRTSEISTTSDSRGRRKVRRGAWDPERGLGIGVPGCEPPRKVSNPSEPGLPRSRSNPDVAAPKISPSKARRQRAYRAKMRRAQERAGSPALETVPEDIPGESRLTEDENETTTPGVKARKPMLNLLHAESVESDDFPMVMEVLDTGYLPLTDTGDRSPRDSEGLESFVIVVTEEVNPSEHESEIRIKEIEEFVVSPQNKKGSSSTEVISSSNNDAAEGDQSDTVIPVEPASPPSSPTTKYPPLEEAYLDHKIQQLDLAYKRVSSPTREMDEEVENAFKESRAQEVEEEVVWEEATELFIYQDPLLVKDFETGTGSPDLFSCHPESSTDCQDSVQAAGGGDSAVAAVTVEKTEHREVEITTTEVSDDAVTCLVGDYRQTKHRHTLPSFMHSQPRFLDVILEESSDVSDNEKTPSKQSRRNTIPSTSQHDVSMRLVRPLRIPRVNFKKRRDPRSFEGDSQPAQKMVVKMAEVKVEKLEPTLYDVRIEEVSSTPVQYGELPVLPESETSSSVDPDDTDNYIVLEQLPDSSDGERFSSECLPRSYDEGGVEIVYLETSSSASSLSSRTLINQEEGLEDDRETEINFDCIPMPRLSEDSGGAEGVLKSNLNSDMPDIIQDASTPISIWLQSSVEPSAMEGSITSLESETRPVSLTEESLELTLNNILPSETSIRHTCTQTSEHFLPYSEDVTDICDDSEPRTIDVSDSLMNSQDVVSCCNAERTDAIVPLRDILELTSNQDVASSCDIRENSSQDVGSSDTSSLINNKISPTTNSAEEGLQKSICSLEVTIEKKNQNDAELLFSENVESNLNVALTSDCCEQTNAQEVVHESNYTDQNDVQSAADCEQKLEICDTAQIEHTQKIAPIRNDLTAISLENMVDDEDVPDLDTLIQSLKRIAESDIPIRRSHVSGEESTSSAEPSTKPHHDSPTKEPAFWPDNKTSSKNPIARMIEDFFKSKRRKEKFDKGQESRTVTSPTYRSYSESVARSTVGSNVTSPVTSRSQSRSQTPCSQSNSYNADMSRNGSLSPALIRELESVLKSHPFNRHRESESSSQDSPVRTFYARKRSIPSSSSYTRSPSRSPVESDFMSPPPYSRQVSSSSAASQSTTVYNPRLSPVSSNEMESTFTSKEPEKSSPERCGVFEQVFRAINLKKGFTTAARPSKLNLKAPCVDRKESCSKGYAVSPRLHRCASEPLNITHQQKSASPLLSPPPNRSHRGQSLATERTLADGKLVFLSSPPLATSPPPCGRKNPSWKGTRLRDNSRILLCLSPSQRRCFKNRLPTPEESAELLDLHEKFIERRAYHESPAPPPRKHSPKPRSVYADTIDWINSIPLYSSDDDWLAVGENGESSDPARSLHCPPRPDDVNRRTGVKVSVESNAEIDLSRLLAILRDECAQQHSHQRLHSSDRHATDSMSPWFTSKDASDADEPVTYVLHSGGKNKYEFRSDCAKNAAINIAKRIEETANKVKWKTEGDATCSKSFSSLLKEKLFWNLKNNIVDTKQVRNTIPKPISSEKKTIPAYKISQQGDFAHLRDKCVTNGDSTSLYEDLSSGSMYWKESRSSKTHSKESLANKEVVSRINVHQNQVLPSPPTKHREPHLKSRPINPSEEERLRDQMYEEYMHQVAERNRRREQKVIKISDPDSVTVSSEYRKDGARTPVETTAPKGAQLEQEFMDKVRARMAKYGLVENGGSVSPLGHRKLPPGVEENNCVVIKAAGSQKEAAVTAVQQLPKHLQEFLSFTVQEEHKTAQEAQVGVWSPHQSQDGDEQEPPPNTSNTATTESPRDEVPPAPVWTPRSAGASPAMERKAFRPVNFESPTLPRKNKPQNEKSEAVPPWQDPNSASSPPTQSTVSGSVTLGKLASPDSPGRLPRAPNPTMTLLQKAREGQIPKGAHYLDKEPYEAKPSDILYTVRKEYDVSGDRARTITHVEPRKFDGIGPTTREGVPVVLRSAVRNESKDKWYKKMYDSLHKVKENGRSSASSGGGASSTGAGAGYQSEPELSRGYDSDSGTKSKTLDRRRETQRSASATSVTSTPPRFSAAAPPKTSSAAGASATSAKAVADSVKYAAGIYKKQPGRIENYEPGHSSISDKEAQQWWDEVLDIFDGWLDERCAKRKYRRLQADARRISMEQRNKENAAKQSFMTHALKESGYESDTQLIVRRRDAPPPPLSPAQQRFAYQTVQKGGEVPLHGLRRAPPDRPKDSPRTEPRRPATFSALKRTAPSRVTGAASTSRFASTPNPPCPPRRRSSKRLPALHLLSTMSFSSNPKRPKRDIAVSDSNVQFLRDKLSVKLGVSDEESPTKSEKRRASSRERTIHISRIESSPPSSKVPRCSPSPCGRSDYTAKRKYESHRSRKDTCSSTRIYRSPELTSPTEVKKAMLDQKKKSGPVVRSSTTIYSSAKNPKKGEEKSLKVTVAISSKGKELLKTTASSDTHKLSTTPSPNRYSPSPPSTISRSKPKRPATISSAGRSSNGKPVRSSSSSVVSLVEETTKRSGLGSLLSKSIATYKSKKNSSAKDASTAKVDEVKRTRKSRPESIVHPGVEQAPKKISSPRKLTSNGKTKLTSISRLSRNLSTATSVEVPESLVPHKVLKDRNVVEEYHSMVYEMRKKPDPLHPPGSDNFFQHLLLQNISPIPSATSVRATSVQHRAQLYLEKSEAANAIGPLPYKSEPTLKSLDVYLRQKKPVSESKFRSLERTRTSRSSSPPRHSRHRFPERDNDFMSVLLKFDSKSENDLDAESPRLKAQHAVEYAKTEICRRSTSEPPASAPPLPSIPPPPPSIPPPLPPPASTKGKITVEFRTISPMRSTLTRSPSHRRIQGTKITRTVKTVESIDGVKRTPVRAKSAGEADFIRRERFDVNLGKTGSSLSLTQLTDHEDYQAYVLELLHSTKKSERFKELNRFYTNLERIGQLEQAASTGDLRPRRKNEEIIDFDRWKQVRAKEKAEAELKVLQNKLKSDQKEKDLLYLPRDVDAMRWKGDRGLRCKEKSVEDLCRHFKKLGEEESELEASRRKELDAQKDVYKPLWRGYSVVNLASNLKNTTSSHRGRPISGLRPYETSRSWDRRHSSGYRYEASKIGTRIWSSLSMEQVNKLKCELNEIYSSGFGAKRPQKMCVENKENYEIIVPPANADKKQSLHIRSNSLLSRKELLSLSRRSDSMKADSISSLCRWKNEETIPDKKTLSETEKKHLSLTISQEVMDRVSRRKSPQKGVVAPRETMGAVAAAEAKAKIPSVSRYSPLSEEIMSPRTCYSLEMSIDDSSSERTAGGTHTSRREKNDFLLVLTPTGEDHEAKNEVKRVVQEWATPKTQKALTASQEKITETLIESAKIASASETESASSETSTKTVIRIGNNEEFQRKVDYFESMEDANKERSLTPKIEAHEMVQMSKVVTTPSPDKASVAKTSIKRSFSSSSFSDLKELFGESVAGRNYATLPVRRRPPPQLLAASSTESVMPGRSRSTSPDPTKYYRAYIRMVKNGDVHRLKNQFESLDDLKYMCARSGGKRLTVSSRCRSDPELRRSCKVVVRGQEFGDVDWLRRKYETRTKRRASPVSRKALSPDVRFMPHINVISKTASLQRRSAATPTECRIFPSTGEVDRIRRKFESELSLLGQMFTSTPDIHELRDIAPYLSCKWIAHQYPLPDPTFSRSVSSLELRRPSTPARPRPASASPGRRPILKAPAPPPPRTRPSFAGQHFDASIHQPTYRYQPPPPQLPRPRRPWTALDYWWRHCHATRPTVTFKEGELHRGEDAELPPIPPPVPPAPAPMLLSEATSTEYAEMEDVEKLFTKSFAPLPKGYDSEPESPHRYVDSEVTIRYKSPVSTAARRDAGISEEELARRQAEAMRRLYQEERRRKYLTELQDINARRHTDYFTPSQKSPIPLNRYDDFPDERFRSRTPEPRLVARALYNFVGQTPRELSFRRGDIIFVKRQIDKNWFEGEHNAMVGLFPFNYVEILPYDGLRTPTKPREGQARAKYNFIAQTSLELSLIKGELVTLIRRVDNNWFEGRIGIRKGIFPVTYVDVLLEPGDSSSHPQPLTSSKPVASPAAHSIMLNGGAAQMSRHSYTPSSGAISPGATATSGSAGPGFPGYSACYGPTGAARINASIAGSKQTPAPVNQTLHIDTQSEPVPYRALYNYRPQNDDELELVEGDLVLVMEKCDDGWYVGSSQRSGFLGTFPGNYVERI